MASINDLLDQVKWTRLPEPPAEHAADGAVPIAVYSGELTIGTCTFRCYQLNDGQRVVDADDIAAFFRVVGEP